MGAPGVRSFLSRSVHPNSQPSEVSPEEHPIVFINLNRLSVSNFLLLLLISLSLGTMIRLQLSVLLLSMALPLLLFPASHALRFDLQSGHTKCIAEDIKSNSMTVGKYSVVNPSDELTVRVTSAFGNSYHSAEKVESGQFAFTTAEAGDYMACFWAPDHNPPATLTVEFDWKTGVAAKDWSNVAKKTQVDTMELELKSLQDTISSIHDEMFYLREREEEMQELNRATNSNMAWLSFLSLVVCLSVAGLQLWHLKTFFEKKKLI